jgi:FixJ family two-component response regulator
VSFRKQDWSATHNPKKVTLSPIDTSSQMELLVLDDDPDMRNALRAILEDAGYSVACFADDKGLIEATAQRTPTCIILDLKLGGKSGLDVLKALKDCTAPIIMISAHGDIRTAVSAVKSGAYDFVEKPFTGEEIVRRVEDVIRRVNTGAKTAPFKARSVALDPAKLAQLTVREGEILEQIAVGSSSKQIAQVLGISYRTVELHRARVLQKLGVRNSTELLIGLSQRTRKRTGDT